MYLHLGASTSVIADDVIGILDYDLIKTPAVKELVELCQWHNKVIKLAGTPKSLVLTQEQLYLVPLSRVTLARRWEKYSRIFFSKN